MRKVSILAFDLSDNAVGRAELLARLLEPRYRVEIVGPQFGAAVWRPVAESRIPYRAVAAGRYPGFIARTPALLRLLDGDLLYASKPRPTSYGLALLRRARAGMPLLLDVDDWEVGFYRRSRGWSRLGRFANVGNPNGLPWTWLTERLVARADGLTVASRFLEGRFGGVLIPHARDTDAWDPTRFDRDRGRAALGVRDERVVMFLGTPRAYKGVDDLVDAVGRLPRDVVLAVVGVNTDGTAASRWAGQPHVRLVGEIPFDDVPRYLVAADVVAVPQRRTPDTEGQVPAKLFDAMALARPIVSTRVSMIPEILEGCGVVVTPGDVEELAAALRALLDDPARAEGLGRLARVRCVAEYSFAAARARLYPLIDDLLTRRAHA